jgi:hypothetical protein
MPHIRDLPQLFVEPAGKINAHVRGTDGEYSALWDLDAAIGTIESYELHAGPRPVGIATKVANEVVHRPPFGANSTDEAKIFKPCVACRKNSTTVWR